MFVLKITFIVLHLNLDRSIILRKSLLFNIYQKNWHNSTQQHQYRDNHRVEFPLKMVKEKKIKDKKFQWKFKLLAEKFTWANNCWVMSTNFWFSKVCWQCSAKFCHYTSSKLSPHNFNFHWRWSDGIESRLPFKIFSTSNKRDSLKIIDLSQPKKCLTYHDNFLVTYVPCFLSCYTYLP